MSEREQRLVFGEVAELYDRVRPRYPGALSDRVARLAGPGGRVVEVGAGTGILTRDLLARGLRVTALEPSADMARVLRATCPGTDVVAVGFEEWSGPTGTADVVAAGQSWHWLRPEARVDRAAAVLRPGGWLVLAWNREDVGADLHDAVQVAYQHWTEDCTGWRESVLELIGASVAELEADRRFARVAVEQIGSAHVRTRAEYLDLLSTHSPHRMLSEPALAGLLRDIGAAIDAVGGAVRLDVQTSVVSAELVR